MKLTWSEASVFAFVWACALGYIVASRILEWNFERFLPSNWYFVVKKKIGTTGSEVFENGESTEKDIEWSGGAAYFDANR